MGSRKQVVLFSEVANVLSLWEVEEVVLFSEVTNVLSLWEVEEVVLFSEVPLKVNLPFRVQSCLMVLYTNVLSSPLF